MSKSTSHNLFIDTCVFERRRFDFKSPLFNEIAYLVRRYTLHVYTCSITNEEIKRRIGIRLREGVQHFNREKSRIKNLVSTEPFADFPWQQSEHEYVAQGLASYTDYLRLSKTIILPVTGVDAAGVVDDWIQVRPPFSSEKSDEFKDAIAISSLSKWCSRFNTRLHVVSHDVKFREACESDERLIVHDDFRLALEAVKEGLDDVDLTQSRHSRTQTKLWIESLQSRAGHDLVIQNQKKEAAALFYRNRIRSEWHKNKLRHLESRFRRGDKVQEAYSAALLDAVENHSDYSKGLEQFDFRFDASGELIELGERTTRAAEESEFGHLLNEIWARKLQIVLASSGPKRLRKRFLSPHLENIARCYNSRLRVALEVRNRCNDLEINLEPIRCRWGAEAAFYYGWLLTVATLPVDGFEIRPGETIVDVQLYRQSLMNRIGFEPRTAQDWAVTHDLRALYEVLGENTESTYVLERVELVSDSLAA